MEGVLYQHLFELTFKKTIDPIILEKLKRVNINWRESIDKIFETTDIWKSACLNEIPSGPITRMITRLFPTVHFENYHQLEDPIIWHSLYISYRKSTILSKLQVSIQVKIDFSEFLRPGDDILSFTSRDKYFAFGTSYGTIYVFDIDQLIEPVHRIILAEPIKDIKFWFPDTGALFLVALISPHYIQFWNLSTMMEVPCNGNAIGASICCDTLDRLFVINKIRGLYEYKHTDKGIAAYRIMNRLEEGSDIINLFSENNKIIITADDDRSLTLLNYRFPTPDEGNDLIKESNKSYLDEKPLYFARRTDPKYLFLTSNVILRRINITQESFLIFYDPKSNWRMLNPFRNGGKGNFVTSGILHGKLLILGFKSGHVRIFTVENIELLKKSNLNLELGTEYQVADKSIEWLELLETREKLIIIAITNYKVYFINFFPENSTQ